MKQSAILSAASGLAPVAAIAAIPCVALAHGVVGQRFFPATIATDDPFVADELSFPTLSSVRSNASDEAPAGRQTSISAEFSKRITPNFGLSLGTARQRFTFSGVQPAVSGSENLEVGLKYQFYKNEAAESLMSAGLVWEVGGTGSRSIGAERFSTYTPTFYFGKGLGQLSNPALRPLALTGTLGVAVPGRASTTSTSLDPDTGLAMTQTERNPHVLQVGLALQYSIPYLQANVKDAGLGAPWNRLVPIVEIAASKPLDRVSDRGWIGTVNPGVLWEGQHIQLGLEAIVPMNRASGRGIGVQAQLHFFLDDMFPRAFGRPLLGGVR